MDGRLGPSFRKEQILNLLRLWEIFKLLKDFESVKPSQLFLNVLEVGSINDEVSDTKSQPRDLSPKHHISCSTSLLNQQGKC
jgi:hypothetical protein